MLLVERVPPDNGCEKLKHKRVVDIYSVIEQSRKLECHTRVCPKSGRFTFLKERRVGLHSKFVYRCNKCNRKRIIHSAKESPKEVNSSLVAAVYSIGKGYDHLEELLTGIDVPSLAYATFQRLENFIGKVSTTSFHLYDV